MGVNDQAKKEVGDLLKEYVVSPLNRDIEKGFHETTNALNKMMEQIEQNTKPMVSLASKVERLMKGFSEKIDEKIENEVQGWINNSGSDTRKAIEEKLQSVEGSLGGKIDTLKEQLDGLSNDLKQELSSTKSRMESVQQDTKKALSAKIEGLEQKSDALFQSTQAIHTELAQYQSQAREQAERYQKLFIVSVAVGAVDLLGILALIFTFFHFF